MIQKKETERRTLAYAPNAKKAQQRSYTEVQLPCWASDNPLSLTIIARDNSSQKMKRKDPS
jgi:hypothetical protein